MTKNISRLVFRDPEAVWHKIRLETEDVQTIAFIEDWDGFNRILGKVIKNNNRGWTVENYSITGNKTEMFFSRGDWKEEKN